MRIKIEFDSCWQTGFLGDNTIKGKQFDLNKNDNSYSNGDFKGRLKKNYHASSGYEQKFIATSSTRGEKQKPLSKNTILGVLGRLIGDQRPLWKAKQNKDFYFSDIEHKVLEPILPSNNHEINELVYLTNKSDVRCTKEGFLGVLDNHNPWFFSDHSPLLWSVLYLNKTQLIDFILKGEVCGLKIDKEVCKPTQLMKRINTINDSKSKIGTVIKTSERLQKEQLLIIEKKYESLEAYQEKISQKPPVNNAQKTKAEEKIKYHRNEVQLAETRLAELKRNSNSTNEIRLNKVISFLSERFPNPKKLGEEYCKDGVVYPMSLYAAGLYLQAERLVKNGMSIPFIYNSKQDIQIQGFSKAGFHGNRDWLNKMAGGRKKAVGTPCNIKKHAGKLEIEINLTEKDTGVEFKHLTRAQEIKLLIENAGVSSFYLGKKGLAYVTEIRL